MSTKRASFLFVFLGLATIACAAEEESAPPDIAFDVQFPSPQAAAATDNVKVYAFEGGNCTDLIRSRTTTKQLPAPAAETPLLTPCQLLQGADNTFDLSLQKDYALLAVGQVKGVDVFIGCTTQRSFGTTKALPISLTFVNIEVGIPATTCTKLSDKCAQRC